MLVLQAVNPTDDAVPARLHLRGFVPSRPLAQVTELAAPLDAANTADRPDAVAPRTRQGAPARGDGGIPHTFPPRSVTVLRFE